MAREVYDSWKRPIDQFNRGMHYYIRCDCGELAQFVLNKYYFECYSCQKKYQQRMGQYVEINK